MSSTERVLTRKIGVQKGSLYVYISVIIFFNWHYKFIYFLTDEIVPIGKTKRTNGENRPFQNWCSVRRDHFISKLTDDQNERKSRVNSRKQRCNLHQKSVSGKKTMWEICHKTCGFPKQVPNLPSGYFDPEISFYFFFGWKDAEKSSG